MHCRDVISLWEFTVYSAHLVNIHPKRGVIKMEETIIPFDMECIKQTKYGSQSRMQKLKTEFLL